MFRKKKKGPFGRELVGSTDFFYPQILWSKLSPEHWNYQCGFMEIVPSNARLSLWNLIDNFDKVSFVSRNIQAFFLTL